MAGPPNLRGLPRTEVLLRQCRFLVARNWDDFLQRDIKATTFPRAFGIFFINTLFCAAAIVHTRKLLPVGKFGIRTVFDTPFYQNFGPLGLLVYGGFGFIGTSALTQASTPSTRPSNSHCTSSTGTC
jgi:hypothetical protein